MSDTIPQDVPLKQCAKCPNQYPATPEFFNRDKKRPDGLYPYCKQCTRKPPKPSDVPEGHRRCPACKEIYPLTPEFFHRNKAQPKGFDYQCNTCKNKREREHSMLPEVREVRLVREKAWNDSHKEYHKEYYQVYNQVNKEALSQRSKRYYQAHKEHHNEMNRLNYQNKIEIYRAKHREYYWTHLADIKRRHMHYYSTHRHQIAEKGRRYRQTERGRQVSHAAQVRYRAKEETRIKRQRYYLTNREHIIQQTMKHRQTTQGKLVSRAAANRYNQTEHGKTMNRIHSHNRRARKRNIPGTHTIEQIQEMLKRQRYRCYYCKNRLERIRESGMWKYTYHIDHTFPISRVAGTDIPANDISYLVLTCPTCNLKKNNRFPHEFFEGGRLL